MKIERLYDAFGELVYILMISDGKINDEELDMFENMIASHAEKNSIKWSFNYEMSRNNNVEETYKKVLFTLKDFGPRHEYEFLFDLLAKIADSDGKSAKEIELINRFKNDLKEAFLNEQ